MQSSGISVARRLAIVASLAAGLVGLVPAGAATPGEGSPDPKFGLSGGVIDWRNGVAFTDSAVQPDGKILATTDFGSLYRYTPQGTSDSTFGTDGILRLGTTGNDFAAGVTLQPDGKIVVVANLDSVGTVMRYLPSGKPDPTFGDAGRRAIPVGVNSANSPSDVAIQSDGKIVIVGDVYNANQDWYAVRLLPDGQLDATFNSAGPTPGVLVKDFSGTETVEAVALQPDGKILIVGSMNTGSDNDMTLFRLRPSGAFDSAFGDFGGGVEILAVGTGDDQAHDVALAPDGHIYVAGDATWANVDAVLVRYTSAGKLDTAWGESGHRAYNPLGYERGASVIVQRNGEPVLAGWSYTNNTYLDFHVLLVRLNTDGTDDASFGTPRLYYIGNNYASASGGLSLMRDGRLVLTGEGIVQGSIYPGVMRVLGDTTRPSAARVTIGSRLSSGRRWISWHATDDNTGVHTYTVQYRSRRLSATKFGRWQTWRRATTAHKGRFSPTAGRRYCFRARATDWAGNTGPFGTARCFSS